MMEQRNLKQIIFMLFDEKLLDEVIRLYEKFDYVVEDDDDIRIAYEISKVYTGKNPDEIIEHLNNIKKLKVSEIYPNTNMLSASLALDCLDAEMLTFDKILASFSKDDLDKVKNEKPTLYNTPFFERISINGSDFDDKLNSISKCLGFIGDRVIFRRTIDKVDDIGYKYFLKIRHSIEVVDYDYGLQAIKDLQEFYYLEDVPSKLNRSNAPELLSNYVVIIDFISGFQVLGYNFSETLEYAKLKDMFRNTLFELSADALLIGEKRGEIVLKTLAETKKRLVKEVGYDEMEVREFMEPIFIRIKETNLSIVRDVSPIKK